MIAVVAASIIVLAAGVWWRRRRRIPDGPKLRAGFEACRADLERSFFELAAASGKPRGLRWKSVEFGEDRLFLRDRRTSEWLALRAVTIAFEAIPGSDMEGLPAVGNLRCGWAVFVWRGGWQATGRTILNLGPEEVLRQLAGRYEPCDDSSPCVG